jgi:hypothetical protein
MPKIVIHLDLSDDQAKAFVGRDVMVSIPAMKAEYLAFIEHANRLHDGLAMYGAVLAKMRSLPVSADLAEGIARLADLTRAMRKSEAALQAFFAPSTTTEIAIARTGGKLQ